VGSQLAPPAEGGRTNRGILGSSFGAVGGRREDHIGEREMHEPKSG